MNQGITSHVTSLDLEHIAESPGCGSPFSYDTPREDSTYKNCLPYTPTGEEADVFKYFCPLCMLHFQHILKSPCCRNYLCLTCTKDWLKSKNVDHIRLDDLATHRGLDAISCPHCTSLGFHPQRVSAREAVRDYSQHIQPSSSSMYPLASPLRIGESFEDMKRKMVPYRISSQQQLPVTGIAIEQDQDQEQELNATPMLQVVREEGEGASAKSTGALDDLLAGRLGFGSTPMKPTVNGLLADEVADGKDQDQFNDRLSESGYPEELEETANESSSLFQFNQFDEPRRSSPPQHQLAVDMVGDIFYRALFHQTRPQQMVLAQQ